MEGSVDSSQALTNQILSDVRSRTHVLHYFSSFHSAKFLKKSLGLIQSYEDVPLLGPKWPISHERIFFGTNHYYYFHLPIGPFQCAKFKKILTVDPEL